MSDPERPFPMVFTDGETEAQRVKKSALRSYGWLVAFHNKSQSSQVRINEKTVECKKGLEQDSERQLCLWNLLVNSLSFSAKPYHSSNTHWPWHWRRTQIEVNDSFDGT